MNFPISVVSRPGQNDADYLLSTNKSVISSHSALGAPGEDAINTMQLVMPIVHAISDRYRFEDGGRSLCWQLR